MQPVQTANISGGNVCEGNGVALLITRFLQRSIFWLEQANEFLHERLIEMWCTILNKINLNHLGILRKIMKLFQMTCTSYNYTQPKTTRDHLEPVDGTSGDEAWKPERSVPELFSDGREAQDDVEVVLDAVDEELHHVFRRWRRLRRFSLDNGEQLGDDFALLVTGEQVRHETLAGNLKWN